MTDTGQSGFTANAASLQFPTPHRTSCPGEALSTIAQFLFDLLDGLNQAIEDRGLPTADRGAAVAFRVYASWVVVWFRRPWC